MSKPAQYITDNPIWTDKVRQIDPSDRVLGGTGEPANWQAEDLANRTAFLKQWNEKQDVKFEVFDQRISNASATANAANANANGRVSKDDVLIERNTSKTKVVSGYLLDLIEQALLSKMNLSDTEFAALKKSVEDHLKNHPQILDLLGDSRTDGASQRIVNTVNKLAKDATTAANLANDKSNQAKQESYDAKVIAQSKQDPLDFIGRGKVMRDGANGIGLESLSIPADVTIEEFCDDYNGLICATRATSPNPGDAPSGFGAFKLIKFGNKNFDTQVISAAYRNDIRIRTRLKGGGEYSDWEKLAMEGMVLGVNQKIKDVTSSRVIGSTYVNTSSSAIEVSISGFVSQTNTGGRLGLDVDGILRQSSSYGTNSPIVCTCIVPSGSRYSYSAGGSVQTIRIYEVS